MHDVRIRICCVDMKLGLLRFQLHFTCGATLFLSFEVRAWCDSAVDFTGKKVVSVFVIFKKSKSPVISTCLSKESALPGVFVDFSVARGELPPPRYGCWRLLAHELHRRAESNFRFVPVAQTQCPSTSPAQTFREKSLSSPTMPCSKAFFNVRNRPFPIYVGSSTDRWIRKC